MGVTFLKKGEGDIMRVAVSSFEFIYFQAVGHFEIYSSHRIKNISSDVIHNFCIRGQITSKPFQKVLTYSLRHSTVYLLKVAGKKV